MAKSLTTKKDLPPAWMPQRQAVTNAQMKRFLYGLMRMGNVSKAARYAKASRTALYQRKATDDEFAYVWEECLTVGVSNLEDVTLDLACNGWEEPVFHDGEQCGTKQRFSPALNIFLLKSHNPVKYRERVDVGVGAAAGAPLSLQVIMNPKAIEEMGQ